MSMLAGQLCCRRVQCAPGAGCATLAGLRRGERVRIVGIVGGVDPAVARRFHDLGFVSGAEVEMVRRAPLGDPIIFRVADYELALRKEQARTIAVEPLRLVNAS